ncbi:MAG: hypothetical protein GWP91_07685, partial [Rhodobacterales bacterium]|nr:hypothetical protein [Rhodobacterales bacterium]
MHPLFNRLAALVAVAVTFAIAPVAHAQTCASPTVLPCDASGNYSTGVLNVNNIDDLNAYTCGGPSMPGADWVFEVNEPAGTEVFLAFTPPNFTTGSPASRPNADMMVMEDDCATGACVSYAQQPNGVPEWAIDADNNGVTDASIVSDGGSYFVHVDIDQPVSGWPFIMQTFCNFCDVTTDVARSLTCSSDLVGETTVGGSDVMNMYTCGTPYAPLTQYNTENIYEFIPQGTGSVTFTLDNMTSDYDIYVLEDLCLNNNCIGGSSDLSTNTDSVTFTAVAGTPYYIIVENWDNLGGTYDLQFIDGSGGCLEDCDDGIDNDLDGPIDCADTDCIGDPACGATETLCDDGLDNDGDGPIDCADTDCLADPSCLAEDCFNGLDDDLDGLDDCADPDCPDTDSDTVLDYCDICSGGDDNLDADGDGVPNACDNCPTVSNSGQNDVDSDGVGNACDVCSGGDDTLDADSDGVPDFCGICPGGDDALDADSDGVPDFCDICAAGDDAVNSDGDGVPDACDNCPLVNNGTQV